MKVIIHFSEGEPPTQTITGVIAIESDEESVRFKLAPPNDSFSYEARSAFVLGYEVFDE